MSDDLTRRALLGQAAAGAAALSLPGIAGIAAATAAGAPAPVPLPSGAALRADVQRMVDMGPRYTGTAGHERFIAWLQQELVAAGVVMLAPDHEKLTVWEATDYGLELLEGAGAGPTRVAAYYPRSQETGPGGVTGPLVYGGVLPLPALNADVSAIPAAIASYPAQLATWAHGLTGTLAGGTQGSILLVDVPMPLPISAGVFVPISTYLHWDGHSTADWLTIDYKRPWLAPGVTGIPTAPFKALGAKGIVFVIDAPYEALKGNYMPFENGFEDVPALFVDRDTGAALRQAAAGRPKTRLRLEATRRKGTSPALLGYLPGTTKADEALIVDTHTDGEGFVEENGGIAMVHLARHFASLRGSARLKRTLVFSLWPGHMASGMPQLKGVISKHQDIVRSAAAAITIEHLGCSEWIETADKGYHATGEAETLGVWTTQGKVFDICKAQTIAHDVPRAALLRPPVQFGVGGAFQSAGVPQIGFLAGPYYLLRDSADGDMDKFDGALAAKQVAWIADMLRDMDAVPAAELAQGDPTLGTKTKGPGAKFPPAPLGLGLKLQRVRHEAGSRQITKLHSAVTIGRPATVRVHADLSTGAKRMALVDRVVHLTPGTTPVTLTLGHRARQALAAAGAGGSVVLTARVTDGEEKVTRTAKRRVGV